MQDFYPPYEYLCIVADRCPRALSTFLMLWRESDEELKVFYTPDEIKQDKNMSYYKFKTDLRNLAYEGLLEWAIHPSKETVQIILAGYEIDAKGFALC